MQFDLTRETAIRWSDPDPKHVALLREGGITAVVAARNEGFEKACLAAGIRVISEEQVQTLGLHEVGKARPGVTALVKAGMWPGVRGRDPSIASATSSVWIDQNCHLVGYLRALHPRQPAVLGYLPDSDAGVREGRVIRFESLELALTEAWVAGGNYVISLGTRFRDALLKGAPDALAAWRGLGRTARWLRDNAALFRQPVLPIVTVLVDEGESAQEIANLSFRHNVSPALEAATNPPAPDPRRRLVLVAAGIDAPQGQARRRILAHAQAGAIVVADEPGDKAWWRMPGLKAVRSDPDRQFFSIGKGQVVAYKEPVTDPGDLALDLTDIVGQKRRPIRVWNCQAAVVLATLAPRAGPVTGAAALHVINYGQPVDLPVLARIQGNFTRATLLRPDAEPLRVRVARRGTSSEVAIPRLGRVATVVFN